MESAYTFYNIYGNEQIKKNLQDSIFVGRVSHAYIFSAPQGMGKKLLSYTFAKTLQCEEGGVSPCNACKSCITFESGNHTDVFFVKAKGKSIGVDDVREQITAKMETKPYQFKYKIFIVEKAHEMTVAAQNALLKTMEEPASYGVFILLAENHNLFLPTILSRSVVIKLKPLKQADVFEYLVNVQGMNNSDAEAFSIYAEGNIGRAASLASDELFIEMRNKFLGTIKGLDEGRGGLFSVFPAAQVFLEYKERIQEGLSVLCLFYRDALVFRATGNSELLQQRNESDIISEFAQKHDVKRLYSMINSVVLAKKRLLQNANMQLTLECMLAELL